MCNICSSLPILDFITDYLRFKLEILSATKAFCSVMGFTSNSRAFVYVICTVQYVVPLKALPIVILFQQSFIKSSAYYNFNLVLSVNKTVYLKKKKN